MRWFVLLSVVLVFSCQACSNPYRVPSASPDRTSIWGYEPSLVVFDSSTYGELNDLYREITLPEDGVEFLVCFDFEIVESVDPAMKENLAYRVTGFTVPPQDRERNSVTATECRDGAAGVMHTHPINHGIATCHRSRTDRREFWKNRQLFQVIWCGPDSIRWYTRSGEQGGIGNGRITWSQMRNL